MSFAVCTLFEGTYHYGIAALSNSLYKRGFRGNVFAGYRGKLPDWARKAKPTTDFEWRGSTTLQVGQGMQVHFLPVDTEYHFSNYKPQYMQQLFDGAAKEINGLVYLDPDIVVKCKADFFEYWLECGVTLVHEIISNDMSAYHPIRQGWAKLIEKSGRTITAHMTSYINGGFCGVTRANRGFLDVWAEFIEVAIRDYGHKASQFAGKPRTTLFYCADQDAINIAAMCSGCPVSLVGPDGMDFANGGWTLSHATCQPKPWNNNYFLSAVKGIPPSQAEHNYWKNVRQPITPYASNTSVTMRVISLKIAAFIGRFYRRN